MQLLQSYIDGIINNALEEDIHYVDVTTDYLIPDGHTSQAYYVAKDSGVICGMAIAARVFELVGGGVTFTAKVKDGGRVQKGPDPPQGRAHRAEHPPASLRHRHGHAPLRRPRRRDERQDHRHPQDPARAAPSAKVRCDGRRRVQPSL